MIRLASLAEEIKSDLESGLSARSLLSDENKAALIQEMLLLTAKPILYVCNVDEEAVIDGNAYTAALKAGVASEHAEVLFISAAIEADLIELEEAERNEFLEEMGLSEPGVHQLTRAAYRLLQLITYFTAGEKEVRAWTVIEGTKAPQAAGVIHSDFEKGFIRAEVIKFDDYIKHGSEAAIREAGKLMVEGKDYVVQDADVMHFRFNV